MVPGKNDDSKASDVDGDSTRLMHYNSPTTSAVTDSDGLVTTCNHGTTTVVRYPTSRRSILSSWINSLLRSHGGIRPSRYHAKRTRCVTNNLSCPTVCHSSRVNRRTLFYSRLTSVCNSIFLLLVGYSRERSPWLANNHQERGAVHFYFTQSQLRPPELTLYLLGTHRRSRANSG